VTPSQAGGIVRAMNDHRRKLHIVGASSSGTTTLGAALAARIGGVHLDTDSVFWEATDPPFTTQRPVEDRLAMMRAALDPHDAWVISGSLMGWGDAFIPQFGLVVFLHVPQAVRMARLLAREQTRYGVEIEPGGRMHDQHKAFVAWAASYETEGFGGRSLERHRAWLAGLPCPVLEITGTPTVEDSGARVLAALS
jgi:adenylate kinase family enzyme